MEVQASTRGVLESGEEPASLFAWLGQELEFASSRTGIGSRERISCAGTGALCSIGIFLYDLMREFLPKLNWDRVACIGPIQVEDILAWADAHHARHGTWRVRISGGIPGTSHTWNQIDHRLTDGYRGLSSGTSLAKFLQKHRGVRFAGQAGGSIGRADSCLGRRLLRRDSGEMAHGAVRDRSRARRKLGVPSPAPCGRGCRGFHGSSLSQLLAQRR